MRGSDIYISCDIWQTAQGYAIEGGEPTKSKGGEELLWLGGTFPLSAGRPDVGPQNFEIMATMRYLMKDTSPYVEQI